MSFGVRERPGRINMERRLCCEGKGRGSLEKEQVPEKNGCVGWSVFKDWGALCRWKVHDKEPDTRDGLRYWEDMAKKGRAAHGPESFL